MFPYSERPGTRALTDIDHVVPQEEKHRRARLMIDISEKKLARFTQSFENTVRKVLVEHSVSNGVMHGFTDNYIKVSLPADKSLCNSIVDVRLHSADGEEMSGETVKQINP